MTEEYMRPYTNPEYDLKPYYEDGEREDWVSNAVNCIYKSLSEESGENKTMIERGLELHNAAIQSIAERNSGELSMEERAHNDEMIDSYLAKADEMIANGIAANNRQELFRLGMIGGIAAVLLGIVVNGSTKSSKDTARVERKLTLKERLTGKIKVEPETVETVIEEETV